MYHLKSDFEPFKQKIVSELLQKQFFIEILAPRVPLPKKTFNFKYFLKTVSICGNKKSSSLLGNFGMRKNKNIFDNPLPFRVLS